MSDRRADRRCWNLLAVFTLALAAVNIHYSIADRRPPTYDDAWFLENSLVFYHRLTEAGLRGFLPAYAASFGTKAPLLSVLPLALYPIFGVSQNAALLVNSGFLVITNLFLFLLVRRLFGSAGAALAAVLFYQTMPLAYGLSRAFLADYGLTALVIAWLYCLVASDRLSSAPIDFLLGVLLGAGLLLKITFPAYVAGPLLLVWMDRRRNPPDTGMRRPLLWIAAPALPIAATWYAFNLPVILRYAWQGAYGEIGAQYGFGGLRHWLMQVVERGLSVYYAGALLVLGVAALLLRRSGGPPAGRSVMFLLAWLVPPLLATAAGRNREIRLFIPLLPVFAVLLAAALFRLARSGRVQAALTGAVLVFPLCLYAELSFHSVRLTPQHEGHDHPVRLGPFVAFGREFGWARPPDNQGAWEQRRILEALHNLGVPPVTPRYVVVGVEHPYLNANLLSYLNAYARYPYLFTSLGYAEPSVDRALERLYRLDARYLIMGEGFHSNDLVDFLNQVNTGIQQRIDRGEVPFRLRAKVTLTHGIRAVLYEKEAPWTTFPAGAAAAPTRPLAVDFSGGVRFLGYDWKRRDAHLAELTCYWTAPHPVVEDFRVHLTFHREGRLILVQDHLVTDGRHPMYEWKHGEIVTQTLIVPLPPGPPLTARLWLTPWGVGEPHQIAGPREYIHQSVIPLRLEE
jgi:hypothetical protein